MRYVSTRGAARPLAFDDVLLAGLAPDGGLYVPKEWPRLTAAEIADLAGRSYAEITFRVLRPFVGNAIRADDLEALVADAYAGFGHEAVAPLRQLGPNDFLLELFHGPTLAFKDYALQVVGRLFDHVLRKKGARVTIVGATSGDTGSAAIDACRDREAIDIFVMHPRCRTSEVQRRQMTTVLSPNVHNIALKGTFDDCQDLLKAMFADVAFRDRFALSAVNSINWARVAVQVAYYVASAVALGAPRRRVAFTVPTGNFGNIFAAHAARRMGLPIASLVVASNRNDILWRTIAKGDMSLAAVEPSLSPSMDIQVSSNFERLLFELWGRKGKATAALMTRFRAERRAEIPPARLATLRAGFAAGRCSDEETIETIRRVHQRTGELLDPHGAVAVHVAGIARGQRDIPMVALACAHPAKFPDAVERATGIRPALPPRLADLHQRRERVSVLPNDLRAVEDFVAARARMR
ncbi:MAG: threonine synthase [Alphaproteobacteria bacterium]|nr:threonine synthase [Alphaproteobacteria bacterium]